MDLLIIADPKWSQLALLPSGIPYVIGDTLEELAPHAPEARIILNTAGNGAVLRTVFPLARKVEWVHSLPAGVEGQLFPELVKSPVPFTNARGVYKESLGEFAMAAVLFFAKDLRRLVRQQHARVWEQFDVRMVSRQTLGIVGYGEIGRAVGRRAESFGMRVLSHRRRDGGSEKLRAMLAECDYVVLSAPLTVETRGMIGEAEFAAVKHGSVLINIGRGPVVDEAALIRALRDGRLGGAALDVFDVEPLPAGHPFWTMDNVLLSPHSADHIDGWMDDAMRFFVHNLERFRSGQPLENVVDKRAGY